MPFTFHARTRLCERCVHGHVHHTDQAAFVYCRDIAQTLTREVVQCSRFKAPGQLDLWDMQRAAYILEQKRRRAGFSGEVYFRKPKQRYLAHDPDNDAVFVDTDD